MPSVVPGRSSPRLKKKSGIPSHTEEERILETNALNHRAWEFSAVLSRGIPGKL